MSLFWYLQGPDRRIDQTRNARPCAGRFAEASVINTADVL
ncbi:hypothetical protein C8D72_1998 [Kushneria indalinina DSM 14324]|uniref:Uncharacterized protein n=1 Tax=Kushneria indalinina DSM 14324 TaxID=1122140 RepID=A0A3D9DWK0_9GAMM|nr:hypothetical protein C8D72_1998 [Kushneria indalinina DSM 14324]